MTALEKPDLTSDRKVNLERYPTLSTGPLSTEPFISQAFFEKERERIFKKRWLLVGRTEFVPKPGDYFVKRIEVLNASFVISHGNDGRIRAFYNVCRHRGCQVAEGTGNRKFFTCNFHGWVYDSTKGKLAHVPDEGMFYELDKSKLGLREVACSVWNTFIFINVDPAPAETLEQQLGEIGVQLKDYPFNDMVSVGRWGAEVRVNWKVILDAFQEGYHVATVHAGTLPTYFTGANNPFCRPSSARLYAFNRSITIPHNSEYKPKQSEIFAVKLGGALTQGENAASRIPPGVNPEGDDYFSFDINGIFPNWLLDTSAGWFFIHEFWPLAVDRTWWESRLHFFPAKSASDLISQEQSIALLRDAFREDLETNESTQAGMMSGAITEVIFNDAEVACRHSYEAISRVLNS